MPPDSQDVDVGPRRGSQALGRRRGRDIVPVNLLESTAKLELSFTHAVIECVK